MGENAFIFILLPLSYRNQSGIGVLSLPFFVS
ncbi:hypothetical protein SAMN05421790_10197 [Kroppenstedtia eburnea]|uniref:Uncharacterized protein n=1 Tax=Kroppenstedtia eburnea TaxID=714067 RepID=A0A1N7IM73_9BACL|nr:hypothetical protein SAMN05421790_10197 [Kroppenstedtia eburnea]